MTVEEWALVKQVYRPWIDGAITRANPAHVPALTFVEWDAACEQVDRAIARDTRRRRDGRS